MCLCSVSVSVSVSLSVSVFVGVGRAVYAVLCLRSCPCSPVLLEVLRSRSLGSKHKAQVRRCR